MTVQQARQPSHRAASIARPLAVGVYVLAVTALVYAAMARGATGGANNGATAGTTTGSVTNFSISGSEKVLYVLTISGETAVTSPDPVVVWDSAGANQTLTKVAASTGTGETAFLYRLINPTDGVNKTISVTGLSATSRDAIYAVYYTGVDQVTPNDTINIVETSVSNPSSGVITNPAGDWIVGFYARNGSTIPTVTGGGNTLVTTQTTSGATASCGLAEDVDGADDTIDWNSGGVAAWTLFTFNLNASGGAAAATCQGKLSLLGVGCHQ